MNVQRIHQTEWFGNDREEAILQQFRSLISDLIRILRHALNARTVTLYWVNRQRQLFVPESFSTERTDVVFKDRIPMGTCFLDPYQSLEQPLWLEISKEIDPSALTHYYASLYKPDGFIYIQPFKSNQETVALTVVETQTNTWSASDSEALSAFLSSIDHLLQTYLELSHLIEAEKEWPEYDQWLKTLSKKKDPLALLTEILEWLPTMLPGSQLTLLIPLDGALKVVYSTSNHAMGTTAEPSSMVHQAAQSDQEVFSLHLQGLPSQVQATESKAQGVSMAVPLRVHDATAGVLLIHHPDSLAFTGRIRHKLTHTMRVAGYRLEALSRSSKTELFTAPNGTLKSELAEWMLEHHLHSTQRTSTPSTCWVGYAGLRNLATLRTGLTTEGLKMMHRSVIRLLTQSTSVHPPLMFYHADHIYGFIFSGMQEQDLHRWGKAVQALMQEGLTIFDTTLNPELAITAVKVEGRYEDVYPLLEKARKSLNVQLRDSQETLHLVDPL